MTERNDSTRCALCGAPAEGPHDLAIHESEEATRAAIERACREHRFADVPALFEHAHVLRARASGRPRRFRSRWVYTFNADEARGYV